MGRGWTQTCLYFIGPYSNEVQINGHAVWVVLSFDKNESNGQSPRLPASHLYTNIEHEQGRRILYILGRSDPLPLFRWSDYTLHRCVSLLSTLAAHYAVSVNVTVRCPSVRPSVSLSRRSTAVAKCNWYASYRLSIDICRLPMPGCGKQVSGCGQRRCCDPRRIDADLHRERKCAESYNKRSNKFIL